MRFVCAPSLAEERRALTMEDAASWKSIANEQLAADGRWLAYQLNPASQSGGGVTVVARSTRDTSEYLYFAGELQDGAGKLAMSASGGWIAFLVTSSREQLGALGKAGEPIVPSLAIVELATQQRVEIAGVREFAFNSRADWIAALGDARTSTSAASQSPASEASQLTLRHLSSGRTRLFNNVRYFAFDPTGRRLAWIEASGMGSRLNVQELSSGRTQLAEQAENDTYSALTWAPSGRKLAVLRGSATPSLLVFGQVGAAFSRTRLFVPKDWPHFPVGFRISTDTVRSGFSRLVREPPRAPLSWRADEQGIFFGIREIAERPSAKETAAARQREGAPIVWHWQDARLPLQKMQEADIDAAFSYLSIAHLRDGRFVQLAGPTLKNVTPHPHARYLLGYDDRRYRKQTNTTGIAHRDYYLVDIHDGARLSLKKRLQMPRARIGIMPQLSPDGRTVVYLDGETGEHCAYDVARAIKRRIDEGVPTTFYDLEIIPEQIEDGINLLPLQGWTQDGAHVLLTDSYDVWALPLQGGNAINLTGNGRKDGIRYTRTGLDIETEADVVRRFENLSNEVIDLASTIYFKTLNLRTMETGLARRDSKGPNLRQLTSRAASSRHVEARGAPVKLVRLETAIDAPNYYRADESWDIQARLTDANPQQRGIRWSPGARLLTYTNASGEPRKAVLHLPVGFAPGRPYPTIVQVYELQGRLLHQYEAPLEGGGGSRLDVAYWTSQGYAVLRPDIRPRLNRMSDAIVEDVEAGLRAAAKSGVVDLERLGLLGHSFGGYDVCVLVTRLPRFKAAIAVAGPTEWLGTYAETYPKGIPWSLFAEGGTQPYIDKPWWDDWEASRRNSPLFDAPRISTPLLLIHGTEDENARFTHSERLFNVLRRLNDKAVVLLEYPGEGHAIKAPAAVRDATLRQLQFHDHFLKGEPMPEWWAEGGSSY